MIEKRCFADKVFVPLFIWLHGRGYRPVKANGASKMSRTYFCQSAGQNGHAAEPYSHPHKCAATIPALSLFTTIRFWFFRSRQRRDLSELAERNDHLLNDIGITKDEARREVAKRFWS